MDAADRGVHALGPHDGQDFGDALGGQLAELAMVDRQIGFAASAVARDHGARHLAQDACGDLLHAQLVALAFGGVLLVAFFGRAAAPAEPGQGTVLGHHGIHRPGRALFAGEKLCAPTDRAPCNGDDVQAGSAQIGQRLQRGRSDASVFGQRVVDVGEHAQQLAPLRKRPGVQRLQGGGFGH